MSDYEADDERFGTRKQRFEEDQMEGRLAEDWAMGCGAVKGGGCVKKDVYVARTRTSSLIKTASTESAAMSSQSTVRDIIDVDIGKSCSLKHHSSTAINLEFDNAPVIVGLPLKDGAWKEKEKSDARMQNDREENAFVRETPPRIDGAKKTLECVGRETLISNDKAPDRVQQISTDKSSIRETHQTASAALRMDMDSTATLDTRQRNVVSDKARHNVENTAHTQQPGDRRPTATSAISRTISTHDSLMQPPPVPSKAFEKPTSSTFSRTKSAQELTMKRSDALPKAIGGFSSTTAFSRTTSAQELTMKASTVSSKAQSSPRSSTAFSRTTSAQELPTQAPKKTSPIRGKGKEKAVSLPVSALATLDEPRTAASTSRTGNSPPRTRKPIPASLQLIHENFANFEIAIAAQSGVKAKFKKGKGMLPMGKADLKSQSGVFKDCVVVVAHSLNAKPEHLMTRWSLVSGGTALSSGEV
jgi:hypothetical protein